MNDLYRVIEKPLDRVIEKLLWVVGAALVRRGWRWWQERRVLRPEPATTGHLIAVIRPHLVASGVVVHGHGSRIVNPPRG